MGADASSPVLKVTTQDKWPLDDWDSCQIGVMHGKTAVLTAPPHTPRGVPQQSHHLLQPATRHQSVSDSTLHSMFVNTFYTHWQSVHKQLLHVMRGTVCLTNAVSTGRIIQHLLEITLNYSCSEILMKIVTPYRLA
jgi:hypothetical protein